MKSILRQAVAVAFRALQDLVEPCTVQLKQDVPYKWGADQRPAVQTVTADVVFVDSKLKHSREKVKELWAIIKFEGEIPQFSEIVIGAKRYRCDAPLTSYRFVVLVQVHEIQ